MLLHALWLLGLLLALVLAACTAAAQTPTEQPVVEEPLSPVVSATGKVIVPNPRRADRR